MRPEKLFTAEDFESRQRALDQQRAEVMDRFPDLNPRIKGVFQKLRPLTRPRPVAFFRHRAAGTVRSRLFPAADGSQDLGRYGPRAVD